MKLSVQSPPAPPQQAVPAPTPGAAPGRPPRFARLRAALQQTPGQLRGILIALVVLIIGAGVTGMTAVLGKNAVIEETTTQSGRLSVAALELYQALSQADATAASSYLTAGTSSQATRGTYQEALRDATVALTTASGEVETPADADLVAELNARLPVYTGLVETARSYNRLGEPVGATYQRQASTLMRTEMLPAADTLQHSAADQLSESRSSAESFPWVTAALAALSLGVLVWAQLWLTRRTNRMLNLGLVGATVLMVAFSGWLAVASLASASHTERSHEDGAVPLSLLAEAHIAAQQARAEESLVLIARGEDTAAEERYAAQMDTLMSEGGLYQRLEREYGDDPELRESLAAASEAAETWSAGHNEVVKMAQEGQYTQAVEMAVGEDDGSLTSSFNTLNAELTEATETSVDRFEQDTDDARRSLSGAAAGLATLALLALICAAVGIQTRVSEYHA